MGDTQARSAHICPHLPVPINAHEEAMQHPPKALPSLPASTQISACWHEPVGSFWTCLKFVCRLLWTRIDLCWQMSTVAEGLWQTMYGVPQACSDIIVRTNHLWEIHTISNKVVLAGSITRLKAEWWMPPGPLSWRLCGLPTGGQFLLLSHDLGQIPFRIIRYYPGEFHQLFVGDQHKLSPPISSQKSH